MWIWWGLYFHTYDSQIIWIPSFLSILPHTCFFNCSFTGYLWSHRGNQKRHQQKTTSAENYKSHVQCRPLFQPITALAVFRRKCQACLGCYLTTCRQQPSPESFWGLTLSYRPSLVCPPHLKRFLNWVDMSAGSQATRSREIPAVRRVAIHDSAHMPQDYSTTPGGTVFSTTPGGNLYCRLLNKTYSNN